MFNHTSISNLKSIIHHILQKSSKWIQVPQFQQPNSGPPTVHPTLPPVGFGDQRDRAPRLELGQTSQAQDLAALRGANGQIVALEGALLRRAAWFFKGAKMERPEINIWLYRLYIYDNGWEYRYIYCTYLHLYVYLDRCSCLFLNGNGGFGQVWLPEEPYKCRPKIGFHLTI